MAGVMTLQTSKTNVPAEILPYKTEIAVGVVFGPAINPRKFSRGRHSGALWVYSKKHLPQGMINEALRRYRSYLPHSAFWRAERTVLCIQ